MNLQERTSLAGRSTRRIFRSIVRREDGGGPTGSGALLRRDSPVFLSRDSRIRKVPFLTPFDPVCSSIRIAKRRSRVCFTAGSGRNHGSVSRGGQESGRLPVSDSAQTVGLYRRPTAGRLHVSTPGLLPGGFRRSKGSSPIFYRHSGDRERLRSPAVPEFL